MELSRGCISILKNGNGAQEHPYVVQVLSVKPVVAVNNNQPQRYRLQIFDGEDTIGAMTATQVNSYIQENKIRDFTIIKITKCMVNEINGTKIVIVLECDIIRQESYQVGNATAQPTYTNPPTYGGNQPSYGNTAPPPAVYQQPSPYGNTAKPPTYNNYAPPPQQNQQQPYGSYGNSNAYGSNQSNHQQSFSRGAVQRDDGAGGNIVPINAINPYSSKWTIKARITAKSEIRRWSNAKGEGTLFSIDLLDSSKGEIRATFFKDACEKFFPMLEESKVYTFSGGTLKASNGKYSSLKNQYELTFNANADIKAAPDEAGIEHQNYNFTDIAVLATTEPGTTVDVIGVVRSASDVNEIVSTKLGGKVLQKRDLTLVDHTCAEVKLTLWGEKALSNAYDWNTNPIAAFKAVKVGDYGGRSLSSGASTSISINPNIPQGFQIHTWRQQFQGGVIPAGTSLSNGSSGGGAAETLEKRKGVAAIREDGLGLGEKPDYISLKASVTYIRHDNDPWYTACPSKDCNKKVTESMNGQFHCEKCNQGYETCERRYILSLTMTDATGNSWFSLFNDTAEKLLGKSAEELYQMRAQGLEQEYEQVFNEALFKSYIVQARVKQETVNDEPRVKSTVSKLNEIDWTSECQQMIAAIEKY